MKQSFESTGVPLKLFLWLALAAGALLAGAVFVIWLFYRAEAAHVRVEAPQRFPAPDLNVADDRSSTWPLFQSRNAGFHAAVEHSMDRLAARGDAAYEAQP